MKLFLAFIGSVISSLLLSQVNMKPTSYPTDSADSSFQIVTYSKSPGLVKKHHKIEFGFQFHPKIEQAVSEFISSNSGGINPFDPDEISIDAVFLSPSGKSHYSSAFYFIPYMQNLATDSWQKDTTTFHWRLRFAPNEIGNWKVELKLTTRSNTLQTGNFSFECRSSDHKGRLERTYNNDESDRYLNYSETGNTFYAIGVNLPYTSYDALSPIEAERHKEWIKALADNGGNFFRVELGAQNALPDWGNFKNYTSKMEEMWEYDNLIEYAASLNMYFTLFRHHVEVSENTDKIPSWDGISWEENPYTRAFNLKNGTEYFTREETFKWHQNTLRYIFARWGYSPSFAIYEYQEIDRWLAQKLKNENRKIDDKLSSKDIKLFRNWYVKMKDYIRDSLKNDQILLANTYAVTPAQELNPNFKGLFKESDVVGFHKYAQKKDRNDADRMDKSTKIWRAIDKPFFIEEMGLNAELLQLYCCTDLPFHNDIWSSAFMGGTGVGLNWWWDRGIYDNQYHTKLSVLKAFFDHENLKAGNYSAEHWSDKSNSKKTSISTHYLQSGNDEKVIGWVQNSTYYWRNLYDKNSCVKELVDNGSLSSPCTYQDGYTMKQTGNNPYTNKKYEDGYGTPEEIKHESITDNPQIVITGLKYNGARRIYPWAKKHWYKIEYYSTRMTVDGKANPDPNSVQVLHTDMFSRLKPNVPNMDDKNPDWAYKIIYLGKFKKAPNL